MNKLCGKPWKNYENHGQLLETKKTWKPWKSKHAKLWKTCGFFFQRLTKPVPPPRRSPPWQSWNCRNHPLQKLISLWRYGGFLKLGYQIHVHWIFHKPSILPPWLWKPQRAKETHWTSHFSSFFWNFEVGNGKTNVVCHDLERLVLWYSAPSHGWSLRGHNPFWWWWWKVSLVFISIIPGAGTQHAHFNHYVRTGFSIRLSVSLNFSFAKQLQGWHAAMAFGSHYHVRVIPKCLGVPLKKGVSLSRAKYVFFHPHFICASSISCHPSLHPPQTTLNSSTCSTCQVRSVVVSTGSGMSFGTQNHKKCV